eukprot:9939809-Alexandrium_andersonii.AAC.1
MAVGSVGFRRRRTAEVSVYAFPRVAHVAPCVAQCCCLRRGCFREWLRSPEKAVWMGLGRGGGW